LIVAACVLAVASNAAASAAVMRDACVFMGFYPFFGL